MITSIPEQANGEMSWKRGIDAPRGVAFTLIELLVVISIIGVLASLVVGLASVASRKSKESRIQSELHQYITAIESYKADLGFYPPDNGRIQQDPDGARTNQLFYELSGAVFTNPPARFQVLNKPIAVPAATLNKYFGVNGIANSARDRRDVKFSTMHFREGQFKSIAGGEVEILALPVKGPRLITGVNGEKLNPWCYDSSSTNRHNRQTFDLWVEVNIGKETNVFGNWK